MKFSIITITFNRAHLIGETIQSVLNQTYKDFEHIIIDDGSTDNTQEVVEAYKDHRIKYHKLQKCGNLNFLRNYGIEKSNGKIIAILDSDDLWTSNKLETISVIFNTNTEVKFILHNIQYFKDVSILEKPYFSFENNFFENAIEKVLMFKLLPFPIFVFKKEIINKVGVLNEKYYESLQDFLFKVAVDYKIFYLTDCLTKIRIHENNIHSDTKKPRYRYFTDYYFSITKLLFKRKINLRIYLKGILLNTKNLIIYLIKHD